MSIEYILLLILFGLLFAGILTLTIMGKIKLLKAIALLGVNILAIAILLLLNKASLFKKKANKAIEDSKEQDKDRTNIVEQIDNQIKKNKDIINEIKNILGRN